MPLQRIKRITTHGGLARFLEQCDDTLYVIARRPDIPSPYSDSPFWCVYRHEGKEVVLQETAHKRYDVFYVPPALLQAAAADDSHALPKEGDPR